LVVVRVFRISGELKRERQEREEKRREEETTRRRE